MPNVDPVTRAESFFRAAFRSCGYVRVADLKRRKAEGAAYRKGYEVRLAFATKAEVEQARQCALRVGLSPGRPFVKHSKIVQPIYGRAAVEWFGVEIPSP